MTAKENRLYMPRCSSHFVFTTPHSRARRVNQLCYKTAERARVTVSWRATQVLFEIPRATQISHAGCRALLWLRSIIVFGAVTPAIQILILASQNWLGTPFKLWSEGETTSQIPTGHRRVDNCTGSEVIGAFVGISYSSTSYLVVGATKISRARGSNELLNLISNKLLPLCSTCTFPSPSLLLNQELYVKENVEWNFHKLVSSVKTEAQFLEALIERSNRVDWKRNKNN